jgi:hypothetical protein
VCRCRSQFRILVQPVDEIPLAFPNMRFNRVAAFDLVPDQVPRGALGDSARYEVNAVVGMTPRPGACQRLHNPVRCGQASKGSQCRAGAGYKLTWLSIAS